MEFLEIELENLFSFRQAKVPLQSEGVVLISGRNGAGKSSLASKALSWALFGETPGGVKGEGVVNVQNPGGYAAARVRFSVGDTEHQVVRFRNPNGVEIDGARYRRQEEGQKLIEQLIGRDVDVFLNTDYFGQDRHVDFLSGTPSLQMGVLEGTLRLGRLDEMVERTKELAAKTRQDIAAHERNVRHFEGMAAAIADQIAQTHDRIEELETANAALVREANALRYQHVEQEQEVLGATLSESKETKQTHWTRMREVELQLSEVQRSEQATLYSVQLQTQHIAVLKPQIRTIEEAICPTCKNPVDPELTSKLRAEQRTIEDRVQKAQAERAVENKRLEAMQGEIAFLNRELRSLAEAYNSLDNAIQEFETNQARSMNRQQEIRSALEQNKAVLEELTELASKLGMSEAVTVTSVKAAKSQLEWVLDRQTKLQFWMDVFSRSFKNFIVDQALPFLEERTAHHLGLLNNPDLRVEFSTTKVLKNGEERSLFNVTATRTQGGQAYQSLSGGEKQMASFAVGLALSELADSQTGSPSNLMILDEPFTELDDANCEAVIHYVTTELVKRKATILLISNDERMKQLVPKGIHVERGEDGISNVV